MRWGQGMEERENNKWTRGRQDRRAAGLAQVQRKRRSAVQPSPAFLLSYDVLTPPLYPGKGGE